MAGSEGHFEITFRGMRDGYRDNLISYNAASGTLGKFFGKTSERAR